MQSRRRRKKAARRRCARPIKAKPAPVRSSQSRGRAVVAEPEILRRGYDGHRQSEGIRFFAGPRRAHLASNPSQRRQESERCSRSLCVRRDPARGWHRPSLIARIIVAERSRRVGLQHYSMNPPPEMQRSIRHEHAAPRPRSGAPVQWESGRAPTGAAAIFRRSRGRDRSRGPGPVPLFGGDGI